MFVTSKIWLTFYQKDRVALCLDKILKDLQLEYCDLILLHWPHSFKQTDDSVFPTDQDGKVIDGEVDFCEAWQGLEPLHEKGLAKSIGISNFTEEQVERVLKIAKIKPVTNQVECHPYLNQEKLRKFCASKDIVLTAYSPLGNPGSKEIAPDLERKDLLADPFVKKLAEKYNKNPGQILIRYQIERNIIVIPKSVSENRIKTNIQVFDFKLEPSELEQLMSLDQNYRTCSFVKAKHLKNYPF